MREVFAALGCASREDPAPADAAFAREEAVLALAFALGRLVLCAAGSEADGELVGGRLWLCGQQTRCGETDERRRRGWRGVRQEGVAGDETGSGDDGEDGRASEGGEDGWRNAGHG